jgi:hypothetical protein
MESQLSLHLQNFNNRIKVMNQTNSRDLTLSAVDARNLHNDIFDLLIQIQALTEIKQTQTEQDTITIQMDGGKFG